MDPVQEWSDFLEFLVSCVSMSVGLGNLWRFPFIVYENGGGTFLFSYIIILFAFGIPLYFLELALGQFASKASLKMFHSLAPAFTGVGALQVFATICASSYYSPILAIMVFYFVKSFTAVLPWGVCFSQYGDICLASSNSTDLKNMTSSTELFFTKYLFKEPRNLDNGIGIPDWRLALGLFLTWFGTFFVLTKGIRTSGKTPYFFGLYPYFLLFIMLGVAISQKGSGDGLSYFFRFDWNQLLDVKLWYNAVSQCLYSLGIGFGTIILLASLSPFKSDINFIAVIVPIIDASTSLLCGLTIFSILGNMAHHMNTDVDNVIKSGGIGLFFITYPEALTKVDAAPFVMSILCFSMVYALGFGTLLTLQQVVNGQIVDYTGIQYWKAAAVTSVIGYVLGLIYITPGGMYMVQLVDLYGVSMIIYIAMLLEILCIVLGYGLRNICWDIEFMTMRKINAWYRCVWGLIAPIFFIVIYILYLITLCKNVYMKTILYPTGATVAGWLLFFCGITLVPSFALCNIYSRRAEDCPEMFWDSFNHRGWSPVRQDNHDAWLDFRELLKSGRAENRSNAFVSYLKSLIGR